MARPIMGNTGSNTVNGTNRDDKLQGKGGNDILRGGNGNDDIDGGQGFDTARYSGSFFEYTITQKGTGNNKVTVVDGMPDRDGTDALKHVEALEFNDTIIRLDQNNAAITRADQTTTDEDSTVEIDVLANDADFEGDDLTITEIDGQGIAVGDSVTLGSGATVTLNPDMTLTYDPNGAFESLDGDEQDIDTFTYTATDSQGAESVAEDVTVTVEGRWEAVTYVTNGEVDEAGQKPGTEDVINGSGIPAPAITWPKQTMPA